jgi:hypothetical protein
VAADAKEEPRNRKELSCRQDKDKWKDAIDEEMDYILNNDTWETISAAQNREIVSCRRGGGRKRRELLDI